MFIHYNISYHTNTEGMNILATTNYIEKLYALEEKGSVKDLEILEDSFLIYIEFKGNPIFVQIAATLLIRLRITTYKK